MRRAPGAGAPCAACGRGKRDRDPRFNPVLCGLHPVFWKLRSVVCGMANVPPLAAVGFAEKGRREGGCVRIPEKRSVEAFCGLRAHFPTKDREGRSTARNLASAGGLFQYRTCERR